MKPIANRPHPWHGLSPGPRPPEVVTAWIEITPFDLVKYETDKATGYLKVDRPQSTSSSPPTLYGFIPRTYCGRRVGELAGAAAGGDKDPLDICIVSERPIAKSEVLVTARVVGGLRAIDAGEADDKIIAVLDKDPFWGTVTSIDELPPALVERLRHYFSTYKLVIGQESPMVVEATYGREHAFRVVNAALQDYAEEFTAG
jgi:inorganic pyrophosphatase